jgi:hypothetical protein
MYKGSAEESEKERERERREEREREREREREDYSNRENSSEDCFSRVNFHEFFCWVIFTVSVCQFTVTEPSGKETERDNREKGRRKTIQG